MKISTSAKLGLALTVIVFGALIPGCAEKTTAPAADAARGGALYDDWLTVTGASVPAGSHVLWAAQTTNTRTGKDTWRCKECHGWDYLGKDGAYGAGSHFTGFAGIYEEESTANEEALLDILKGGKDPRHNFSSVLAEAELVNLAAFLDSALIDPRQHIDYGTKKPLSANPANGAALYSSVCAGCHGSNGRQLNFGDAAAPEYVGGLAKDNPWEVLHKIRFGQPGTAMPSGVSAGQPLGDMLDILAHAQTLP